MHKNSMIEELQTNGFSQRSITSAVLAVKTVGGRGVSEMTAPGFRTAAAMKLNRRAVGTLLWVVVLGTASSS